MSRRRGGIGGAGALLFVGLCFALAAAHTDEEVRIDVGGARDCSNADVGDVKSTHLPLATAGPISISKEGSQPSEHFEFVFPKTIKTFYVPRKVRRAAGSRRGNSVVSFPATAARDTDTAGTTNDAPTAELLASARSSVQIPHRARCGGH